MSVLFLANGNLNGRTIRLIADHFRGTRELPVRLITTGALPRWPEERLEPHVVQATKVDLEEAEALVTRASTFVFAATFDASAKRLVAVARRSGTPSLCVVADVDYGACRFDPTDRASLPDRIGVGDPTTRRLLMERGIPEAILRDVGSPYLDTVLSSTVSAPPDGQEMRVGLLLNPEGTEARGIGYSEDDVLQGVHEALESFPESRLTVRPHPRLDSAQVRDALASLGSAVVDPATSRPTMAEFVSAHHLIVASYSTGLLVARMLGRAAVSFQPSPDGHRLRGEIFGEWDVPIVSTVDELSRRISESTRPPSRTFSAERLLFHPHRSLEAICDEILVLQPEGRGLMCR